jgi:urea transporter
MTGQRCKKKSSAIRSTATSHLLDSTLNAYAQIFFTKNRAAAVLLLVATFVNWKLGAAGLAAVLLTNGLASGLGFDRGAIREGLFALNSLLTGMGLALNYEMNGQFFLVFFAACLLTLFISVATMNYLARLGLPFLVIPFLVSLWVMELAVRQYTGLVLNEGSIFLLNDIFGIGGMDALKWYEWIQGWPVPEVLGTYFKSLAAIFFQGNVFTGVLLALALLISSRIAFSLTVLGYLSGYAFYYFVGADFTQLSYSYIGFNFILTAIALGGFFFIPGWKTYALVVVTAPLIALLIAACSSLLEPFQLPVYSLPFVVLVLTVIYVSNFITRRVHFQKVTVQRFSPEHNLYAFRNWQERFAGTTLFKIALPFFGEWTVSQGHEGEHTHRGEWRHAWDFVIQDEEGNTHREDGRDLDEYLCYNLPVTAPAGGVVSAIEDGVADNPPGEVNVQQNWGNTIVLKHAGQLYTKISHLKEGSFEVKVGDFVKKGATIAKLGNSGRSPQPHLHFQVQATPYIGSKTLKYPLAYYLLKKNGVPEFRYFDCPQEGETISNVKTTSLLAKAFDFQPGKVLEFETGESEQVKWEVFTNALNQSYLYCHISKSFAYFVNDGTLLYFTSFEGNRRSLLYYFYLGAYKVLLGFNKGLTVEDTVPLFQVKTGIGRWLQDFLAPFHIFQIIQYRLEYAGQDDALRPTEIALRSTVGVRQDDGWRHPLRFSFVIKYDRLHRFEVQGGKVALSAKQMSNDVDYERDDA